MYDFLLQTPLRKQWEKIGIRKRSGAVFPLFSIYSRNSDGIGEFSDLKMAIDWCKETKNSILQLLPLNDTGFQPSPFSAQTSIGLNPIHISLSKLIGSKKIKKIFPIARVGYRIGPMKIKILKSIFNKGVDLPKEFNDFTEINRDWLNDFSLFRALKRHHNEKSWKDWAKKYRDRISIEEFAKNNKSEITFWKWVQWQAYEQMSEVKRYAESKNVFIKGDLPLFVSDDSADCWVNRDYFRMGLSTGTPPDDFSKKGQVWGMPPYNWERIMDDDLRIFKQRISYAENFYHLFKIDHLVGLFRTWSVKPNLTSMSGSFDINDPIEQKKRGEAILRFLIKESNMLPCAEDLGTVPNFCRETLKKLGIPGIDVGRQQKRYRHLAVSTLSTHDMDLYPEWSEKNKAGSIEEGFDEVLSSPSVFSINLIFDWLFLSKEIDAKTASAYRINRPGTNSPANWSVKVPLSMEELLKSPKNKVIEEAVKNHLRSPST